MRRFITENTELFVYKIMIMLHFAHFDYVDFGIASATKESTARLIDCITARLCCTTVKLSLVELDSVPELRLSSLTSSASQDVQPMIQS